MYTNNISDRLL